MDINYELQYKQDGDLCFITTEMLISLIHEYKKNEFSSDIFVLARTLLPKEYECYLVNTVNTCRHEKGFVFPYIRKVFISADELEQIIQVQLKNIFINNQCCFFDILRQVNPKSRNRFFKIGLTDYFVEILSDVNSRIYFGGRIINV